MNNKVNNPEVNVSKTINMNEKNYLEVILENEKNMSNNLSIAIDEASNDLLFDKFYLYRFPFFGHDTSDIKSGQKLGQIHSSAFRFTRHYRYPCRIDNLNIATLVKN